MKQFLLSSAIAVGLVACDQSSNHPTPGASTQTMRVDTAPIAKRLPKLGPIQAAWWNAKQVSINTAFSPPGNPVYRLVGFAQLGKARANEISQEFQWQQKAPDWKPALTVTNLNLDSTQWSQSAAFTRACKPQQIPGELFFERQTGIVYFELEIE